MKCNLNGIARAVLLVWVGCVGVQAHAASVRVLQVDNGVFWQPQQGNKRTVTAYDILPPNASICFTKKQNRIKLQTSEGGAIVQHQAAQLGCTTLQSILDTPAQSGSTVAKITALFGSTWHAIMGQVDGELSDQYAAARSSGHWKNQLCTASTGTEMLVAENFKEVFIPVAQDATGHLVQLNQPQQKITLQPSKNGLLALPNIGKQGEIYQLTVTGSAADDALACSMRIKIVPKQAVPVVYIKGILTQKEQTNTALLQAAQGMALVEQFGHAWKIEALRMAYPAYVKQQKNSTRPFINIAKKAHPTCANTRINEPVAFAMPLLATERSYLVAGKQTLYLAWKGGQPPHAVDLQNANGESLLPQGGAKTVPYGQCIYTLRLKQPLQVGQHRLEIKQSDAQNTGVFVENNLIVVPANKRPTPPKHLQKNWQKQADWLAQQDGGKWRFQAAQEVAKQRHKNAQAHDWLMREALKLP